MIENTGVHVVEANFWVVGLILRRRLVIFGCTHEKLNIIKFNKNDECY